MLLTTRPEQGSLTGLAMAVDAIANVRRLHPTLRLAGVLVTDAPGGPTALPSANTAPCSTRMARKRCPDPWLKDNPQIMPRTCGSVYGDRLPWK